MSKKVVSLKKEVANNLVRKGIPNFHELNLKRVNMDVKNVSRSVKNTIFKKAGKGLLEYIDIEECAKSLDFSSIENLINNGPISISIEEVKDEHQLETLKIVRRSEDEVYLKINMVDLRFNIKQEILSFLKFRPSKAREEGVLAKRDGKHIYYSILSLETVLGIAFIFNEIAKYESQNQEMIDLLLHDYFVLSRGSKLYVASEDEREIMMERWINAGINSDAVKNLIAIDEDITHLYSEGALSFSHVFPRSSKFDSNGHQYFAFVSDLYFGLSFFANIYDFIIGLNDEETQRVKRNRNLASDYATSYETKKNIPDYVKEAMGESAFNSHFGFVEFDELVDLDEMKKIEDEWEELLNQINIPVKQDHALRFRRLGRHKAGGLYFPAAKSVCVDLDSPGSLIHEVMHMIDYTHLDNDNLSNSYKFRPIINMYKNLVQNNISRLDDDNSLKKQWNGRSKYNKDYFLSSEEIFARAGEVYIKHKLNFDSSLINANGALYPQDKEFINLIVEYYDKLGLVKEIKQEEDNDNKYIKNNNNDRSISNNKKHDTKKRFKKSASFGKVGKISQISKKSYKESSRNSSNICDRNNGDNNNSNARDIECRKKSDKLDDKMKEICLQMVDRLNNIEGQIVDEVQFFEFKTYIDKKGNTMQAIRHSQKTGDFSVVYTGKYDKEYNFDVILIGEKFSCYENGSIKNKNIA